MCNLYSHTKGPKAIRDLANAMGGDWLDNAGNLEPQPSIFPDGVVPVVRSRSEGGRELLKMPWGFPAPPNSKSNFVTKCPLDHPSFLEAVAPARKSLLGPGHVIL